MGYPDPGQRVRDGDLRGDQGYQIDPEYRSEILGGPGPGGYPMDPDLPADPPLDRRPPTAAELDDVFDDPSHGDPGMDRMGIHLVWEAILLVAVGVLVFATRRWHPDLVSGAGLRVTLLGAAALGLVAAGLALSLRAGAVNLAAGPVAVAAGLYHATHDVSLVPGAVVAVLIAAAAVGAIGLVVVVFQVPAWAASLGGAMIVMVWIFLHTQPVAVTGGYQPLRHATYWYLGFAALSVLGGLFGLVKPIRRAVGRFRPVADPAGRRGAGAAVLVVLALAGSGALAGLGGVLTELGAGAAAPGDGLVLTGLALGAALLGGTSAFGRRGGVFGTALAVTLVALLGGFGTAAHWRMSPYALAAAAVGVGLVVTRLVEALGRPRGLRMDDADGWAATEAVSRPSARRRSPPSPPSSSGGWSSQLPARSLDDTWANGTDDRWGAG